MIGLTRKSTKQIKKIFVKQKIGNKQENYEIWLHFRKRPKIHEKYICMVIEKKKNDQYFLKWESCDFLSLTQVNTHLVISLVCWILELCVLWKTQLQWWKRRNNHSDRTFSKIIQTVKRDKIVNNTTLMPTFKVIYSVHTSTASSLTQQLSWWDECKHAWPRWIKEPQLQLQSTALLYCCISLHTELSYIP